MIFRIFSLTVLDQIITMIKTMTSMFELKTIKTFLRVRFPLWVRNKQIPSNYTTKSKIKNWFEYIFEET